MTTTEERIRTFDAMGIKEELMRSVYSFGCEQPSEIQQKIIVPFSQGKDVIVAAQPATGKATAFTIATIQQIEEEKNICQAIFLTPTRDLALQTQEVIKNFSQYLDIDVFACIGGTSVRESIEILKKGVHIVVGTPGRVLDMIERGVIDTNPIKTVVLSYASEILSQGFSDQINSILKALPTSTQIGMFDVTITQGALDMVEPFVKDPIKILINNISVNKEGQKLDGIKQFYIDVNKEEYKIDTLVDLYQVISVNQSVIFCNSKQRVEWIQRKLTSHNYPVSVIHEEMSMEARLKTLTEFRQGSTRILITTDILDRGFDIQQVSLIINLDMPTDDELYLHRISRVAQFGRKGVAINFITSEEMEQVNRLQTTYETKIVPLPKTFMDYL